MMYYGLDGKPIGLWEAVRLLEDPDARRVAQTRLVTAKGTVCISTVFLVINHNFGDWAAGVPVLWETMVFGGPLDQKDCWRYSSRADAEAGHKEIVEWAWLTLDLLDVAVLADETIGVAP